jgi:hypothetical protein
VVLLAAGVGIGWYLTPDPGDVRLRAFVHARPPVPVVFTSRTEPASFPAAAPTGEGFTSPGQPLWQAREGRLRLLTPRGTVHELTWGRALPDGGTLIDVMGPSVSDDGKRVLFAGRRADDAGRFRLYEVGINGNGLRPLTGGPDDPGCTDLPPMRWRHAGDPAPLPEAERRSVDYDDVDPFPLNDGAVVFASSRTPDLGRDHARRATNLWILNADGSRRPLTANRNNDRWPFLTAYNYIAFSTWSRNREVITADERDVRPFTPGKPAATRPTDSWLGAFVQPVGTHFGGMVKAPLPVWRPRVLFNGRVVFMTGFDPAAWADGATPPVLRVVQAPPGLVANAPGACPADRPLPHLEGGLVTPGPDRDGTGRPLSLATPSPCPGGNVVLAGAPLESGESAPPPGGYGIYLAGDDWGGPSQPAPQLLFDDPEFVDAEPVAVYPRQVSGSATAGPVPNRYAELTLADGRRYEGPAAAVLGNSLYDRTMTDLPGQHTDTGEGPVFEPPPERALDRIRIYASHRDRFDDPAVPRVPGGWELLVEAKVRDASFGTSLPAGSPTVLAGFGADGRVVRWETAGKDTQGRRAAFYAFAGDHYSAARPGGRGFCIGCHPGHSGMTSEDHTRHTERLK